MQVELQAHIAFHLTGRMPQGEGDALARTDLRPALLAGYRDLTTLRYDFPLVLARAGGDGQSVQSLSALFDGAIKEIAANGDGERIRKHAGRLEREIRKLMAEGETGTLSKFCDAAATRIGTKNDELLAKSVKSLRAALKSDGEVIDCDKAMPFRLFQHAWQALQDQKAQKFRAEINKLILKLSDILSAEFGHSKEGMSAERLQASIGVAHRDAFNFETCTEAVAAYRERLPKMTELAKAMAIAKLETDGEYSEARHDAFFAEFGDNGLDADDIAVFPDYLICLRAADFRAAESDLILRAFVAGMPAKLVVQTDDLLEQSPIRDEYLIAGLRGRQLASTAIGGGAAHVLQSSSANLFQLLEQVLRGLAYRGPALFSVFSGASGSSIPPYLTAAAAAESRAFPSFTYDPSAGADWASRFFLGANSQVDLDWPSQRLDYEDAETQQVSETVARSEE